MTAPCRRGPAALRREIAEAGERPRVVAGATYGWYWAADVLEAAGAEVHLAHPLGVQAHGCRRVKNDLLSELPDVVQEVWASLRPIVGLSQRSRLQAAPGKTQA